MISQLLAVLDQFLFRLYFITSQLSAGFLEVLDLDACLLLRFLTLLDVLLEIVFLKLELLGQILDPLGACIDLSRLRLLLLDTGGQLSEPELFRVLEDVRELAELVGCTTVGRVTELTGKLGLHLIGTEVVDELQYVLFNFLSIPDGLAPGVRVFETLAFQVLHVDTIDLQIEGLPVLLTLSLRVEERADFVAEDSNCMKFRFKVSGYVSHLPISSSCLAWMPSKTSVDRSDKVLRFTT